MPGMEIWVLLIFPVMFAIIFPLSLPPSYMYRKSLSFSSYIGYRENGFELGQQVLEYWEFDYRDPRNTGIFLMVTINLEYQDFPRKIQILGFFRENPDIRG